MSFATGDNDIMGKSGHPLTGKARQIYDLLVAADAERDAVEDRSR